MKINSNFEKIKPAVNKLFLLFLSGLMWFCVGVMLISLAIHWLVAYGSGYSYLFASLGFVAALFIHHFGFLKLVDKNLGRITFMKDKPCVFSFMSWKNYLIVIVMITMGITLRHSSIPKEYLSILYIGIGLALLLSSIRYFRVLISEIKKRLEY
ncbi:MAG: hypothetical protein EHM93_08955 [Bacteroidales bacterium]|nr:MAG: hypothetical protein EHM93_08955 [Bacteroidales bacterium]